MGHLLERIQALAARGHLRVSLHGYEEPAADSIRERDVVEGAELDLGPEPAAVSGVDHGIHLEALVVPVEALRSAVRLSVDAQVMDHLRLEQEPGPLDLRTQQTVWRAPSAATANEGSARCRLGVATRRTRRAERGAPAVLIFDEEESSQRPDVVVQRGLARSRLVGHPPTARASITSGTAIARGVVGGECPRSNAPTETAPPDRPRSRKLMVRIDTGAILRAAVWST